MSETRDSLRQAILNKAETKSIKTTFFGEDVEMRQPSMRVVLSLQEQEDRSLAAAQMIVNYMYVPGTDERVFEEADVEILMSMPFGEDLARINNVIAQLTGVDIEEAVKNSEETPEG